MNRRAFLGAIASAMTLDPERLLYVPGRRLISIPRPPVIPASRYGLLEVGDFLSIEGIGDLVVTKISEWSGKAWLTTNMRTFSDHIASIEDTLRMRDRCWDELSRHAPIEFDNYRAKGLIDGGGPLWAQATKKRTGLLDWWCDQSVNTGTGFTLPAERA